MSSLNNTWLSSSEVATLGRAILAVNETQNFAQLHTSMFRATQIVASHDLTGMSVLDEQNRAADTLMSASVYQHLTIDFATMLKDFFTFPGVSDGRYFSPAEPRAMLDFQDVERFKSSLFYEGFYRQVDVLYEVSLTTPGAHGAASTLVSLGRSSRAFSDEERLLLKLLQPHMQQRMRALQALEPDNARYGRANFHPDPPLLFVSPAGHIVGFAPQVPALFAQYGLSFQSRLPQQWRDWLAQQIVSFEAGRPLRALAVTGPGGGLYVHFFHNPSGNEHRLVLEPAIIEAEILTRRETEVAHWLAQGKTNAEIAHILGISAATAKNHVERILFKLKVESRLAAALIISRKENSGRR
jgi:DNA-binding CsgD family transcriptional regulator